jgi:glycosyltransferase involved in cell wall biosynthesis
LVIANGLHAATYWSDLGGTPLVYRAHNLETLWMERYAQSLPPGPRRLYAAHQAHRLRRVEAAVASQAALVLAISERESEALRSMAPAARVEILPLGIDTSTFLPPAPASPPIVMILGTWSWPPNADGAVRFLQEGWPVVRAQAPEARLRIVGKEPSRALRTEAERAGAEVTGRVPSVQEELQRAAALVVPLWAGAGVRVKIVEAMAAGVPVISTPIGAEGLGLRDGEELLLGEDPVDLARGLARLLCDPNLRKRLSDRGRSLARESWSLEATARRQNALCLAATGSRAGES